MGRLGPESWMSPTCRPLLWLALAPVLGLAACMPAGGEGAPGAEQAASANLDRQTAEVHRQLAAGLEAAGESQAALSELELALAADERAANRERAAANEQIASYDLSNRSYEELARLCKRNDPPAQAVRACTLVIAGFQFSVERLPEYLSDRADAYQAMDDLARAAEDYSTAVEIDSAYARALLGRARVRVAMGDNAGAAADYRRAIGAGMATPEIRTERAEVLMADGQFRAAIGEYDRILADPDLASHHGPAYRGRAWAHCRDGQAEAAAVDWQVWLAGGPEDGGTALAVPLAEGGFLPGDTAGGPLEMNDETLAALRAWTEAGCPVRDPMAPDQAAAPEAKPESEAPVAAPAADSPVETPTTPAAAETAPETPPTDEAPATEPPAGDMPTPAAG